MIQHNFAKFIDSKFPILPLIDDPLYIADGELQLDTLPIPATGSLSICSGVVNGLSTLSSDITTSPGGIGAVNFAVKLGISTVDISGYYTADAAITLGENELTLEGGGSLWAALTAGNLTVGGRLAYLGGPPRIPELTIDIGFDTVEANVENFALNGGIIDWEEFNSGFKQLFDLLWGYIKVETTETIRTTVNNIIKDCTIVELIGIINGTVSPDCLNLGAPEGLMELIRSAIEPSIACSIFVPSTEEPDASGAPEITSTVDDAGPAEPSTPQPSNSVLLQPFNNLMYLLLLIAATNALHKYY